MNAHVSSRVAPPQDSTAAFADMLVSACIPCGDPIVADGNLHRYRTDGDHAKNCWYVLYPDGLPAGAFGCWKRGISETWCAKNEHQFTEAERKHLHERMERAKAQREETLARVRAEARAKAAELWQAAKPETGAHPYLATKGVRPHSIRTDGERLVIALRDTSGVIHSLQFISPNGEKCFLPDGAIRGHYHGIGKPNGVLCIAEGYATAASVHEATGCAVAVAFNAGNLKPVAEALRAKYPEVRLIVCADNDQWTKGNPGLAKAREAAAAVGGFLAVPGFKDTATRPTDFNDLARLEGLDAVRRYIEAARPPEREAQEAGGASVELLHASDITPEPVRWLWEGWLAAGKLHMLAGAPGTGKTTIALALAATITTGGRWPDGTCTAAGDVLIWSGEDDPKDTLVPRLLACGADTERVHFVGRLFDEEGPRPFDPACDMDALLREIHGLGTIRLVIVDPVVSAVAADSYKNAEVRRSLQPLVDMGNRTGCAVLGISHFTKGTAGRDPVERVTGSVAFGALPRVVLAAAKLPEDSEQGAGRLFARAKSNIGPDSGGWRYYLEQIELDGYPGVYASRVLWGEAVEGTARELLAQAEAVEDPEDRSATDEAADWLRELLSAGPMKASEVQREARQAGITEKALRRARERLGIKPGKRGFAGGWWWTLPGREDAPTGPEDAQDAHHSGVGIFDGEGHLRAEPSGHGGQHVRCLDCTHWAGACGLGRAVSDPALPVRLCGGFKSRGGAEDSHG